MRRGIAFGLVALSACSADPSYEDRFLVNGDSVHYAEYGRGPFRQAVVEVPAQDLRIIAHDPSIRERNATLGIERVIQGDRFANCEGPDRQSICEQAEQLYRTVRGTAWYRNSGRER